MAFKKAKLKFVQIYEQQIQMKKSSLWIIGAAIALTSCTYQKNNRIEQDDVREGNKRIYGESLDAPARQLEVQYESDPTLAKRAEDIRAILYGEGK